MSTKPKSPRTSLKLPITLAVIMIVLLVMLIVGWVLTTVFAATENRPHSSMYWVFLPIGSLFLSLILAGTITYLVLSIKIINLNRRQSNFINSVTHELKSPLASLKLYLQTLTRYEVSREEKLKFYSGMMEELERLDTLINQVLRAGQLEAGHQIGEFPEEVNLREVLESAIRSVVTLHHVKPEQIQLACDDVKMLVSRVPLEMIFRNLIDNGIKYGGEPPQVEIRVRRMGQKKIAVKITDNGNGIPPKMRKKVFQRFVRLGRELERRRKGTGLGLYIVRMCLRQLDGEIRVRENKHGPGSIFYVLLPVNTATKEETYTHNKTETYVPNTD
ncbi:MAG: HAMP domain-containing sensor histidine kinase [Planctomycetia bacterium]|nr:HAMP domain-containing sensor histidine kinase [Planctomycetia bacterium]